MKFLHCKWGLKGADLKKLIMDQLSNLNISIGDCRGQGYDGAGAVAGRQMCLEKNILAHSPDSTKIKLRDICRTRWIERVNGMDIFQELFVPIFLTLDEMSANVGKVFNADTSTKATSLSVLVSCFQFIVSLVISRIVLDMTLPVT